MKRIIGLFICVFCFGNVSAQMPLRKAFIGIQGKAADGGIKIDTVFANSTMAKLKLKKGDLIQSVNGKPTPTLELYGATAGQIRTDDKISVTYLRNGKSSSVSTKAVMKPYETSPIADITYDWVKFRNGYLRTMTYKPKGKTNVPCILLIPGYGCGSIENYSKSYNGRLMDDWIRSGFAVVTIEKSGLGDSFGCEPCSEVDIQTDIDSFNEGYKYMEKLPFVDTSKLFIWGHSMGGTIAPEIAKLLNPKGVMVFGCVFRPWSEFLLEMHRVQKPLLENLTYQQTEDFTRTIHQIYYEFFIHKKSPAELVQIPEFKELTISELGYKPTSNDMWGRHWKFWQQIDSLDMAKSWSEVKCPVLVLHGGTDYEQCSLVEPMMIEKTVNEKHPGNALWITIPDLDHFMMKSKDWPEAVKNFRDGQYAKGNFNTKIADETVKWLKTQI
ncbi:alpha/beta fold hydrolase [Flavobacterium sp.]|uniref:alpha/beta fold hydrolase n=1 Tax=Flavobacterium sp. TaxID=239 RepID=UPI0039E64A4B